MGLIGNEQLKSYLQKALEENRLPQVLLFSGLAGIGKKLFAKDLAAKLLGSEKSIDLHLLAPDYSIEMVREMIEKDRAAPFESSGKVFILEDAGKMSIASANALLKTLEEPAVDSTFILLTSQVSEMLPTVLSRCTLLAFQPLKKGEVEQFLQERGLPKRFAEFAQGSIGRALEFAQNPALEEQWKVLFHILSQRPSYPEMMQELAKLDEKEAESLFVSILMWHRDQHLRSLGGKSELLFFPEESAREPVSLQKIEQAVERARLAFSRNMKLSHCLSEIFLSN